MILKILKNSSIALYYLKKKNLFKDHNFSRNDYLYGNGRSK